MAEAWFSFAALTPLYQVPVPRIYIMQFWQQSNHPREQRVQLHNYIVYTMYMHTPTSAEQSDAEGNELLDYITFQNKYFISQRLNLLRKILTF